MQVQFTSRRAMGAAFSGTRASRAPAVQTKALFGGAATKESSLFDFKCKVSGG
jgi:hypothetical protein